jgi:hypothetical protein
MKEARPELGIAESGKRRMIKSPTSDVTPERSYLVVGKTASELYPLSLACG